MPAKVEPVTTDPTPYQAMLLRADADPTSPLIIDRDLAADSRVELSVSSVANGAAKAAHLFAGLASDLGRPPRVGLVLPLHWQAITVALGCWAAGGQLVVGPEAADPESADAVVVGPAGASAPSADWPDQVWASRLHPFALPFDVPPPYPLDDLTVALREQPDSPPPDRSKRAESALRVGGQVLTHAELAERARAIGRELPRGVRVLTGLPWESVEGWLAAVAIPLQHAGSVVLVGGLDPDTQHTGAQTSRGPAGATLTQWCEAERVTATAGLSVPGIIRIV